MNPPRGLFQGTNFMTPTWVGYFKLAGDNWAELSRGYGMNEEPIWGVTVRPDKSLGKLFHTQQDAVLYITGLQQS